MTNTKKLKEAIMLSGLSRENIASELGISTRSLNKKIYNKSEFKVSEIETLSQILNIRDVIGIFFADLVDFKSTGRYDRTDWSAIMNMQTDVLDKLEERKVGYEDDNG